jgi:hypothetical protein
VSRTRTPSSPGRDHRPGGRTTTRPVPTAPRGPGAPVASASGQACSRPRAGRTSSPRRTLREWVPRPR